MNSLVANSIYGYVLGFGAGLIFKRAMLGGCIGAGMGGGIAFNKCGHQFNRVEQRELAIARGFSEDKKTDYYIERLDRFRLNFFRR